MHCNTRLNCLDRGSRVLGSRWFRNGICIIATIFTIIALVPLSPAPAVAAGPKVAVYGAPSSTTWNTDVQSKIASTGLFSQVDAFLVKQGYGVPTLAQLKQYNAVFVYSDSSFNDCTALGNVLADYIDTGGGVVLATFAFYTPGGLGIGGRISSAGYLPFTQASQYQGYPLTLVADMPSHPILTGVSSFNGGSSSFHNTISLASGATLIAHWTNGRPLVATKQKTAGRVAGLNFYPPSSSVRSDFWVSSTSGARLMANALVWAAGALDSTPPVITPTITGTQGSNGWYTSDVTVSWSLSDPESGIASSIGSGTTTLTADTAGTTLTCSATNGAGLSNSVSVTIKLDKTPPMAELQVTAGTMISGSSGWYTSNVTVSTTGSDSVSSPVVCTPNQFQTLETSGTVFNGSATNNAGLTTNAAPITIKLDKTPPQLNLPPPAVLEATSPAGAVYSFSVTATDNFDPAPAVSCNRPSGSIFPAGTNPPGAPVTTTVNCTATDRAGLSASGSFTVTVKDTTPPALTVPQPITVEATTTGGIPASGPEIQGWLSTASAVDLVDPNPGVTNNAPAFCSLGTTSVTFTAIDAQGNSSNATSTITVVDTTPPSIASISISPNVLWPANHKMAPVTVSISVSDVCDNSVSSAITSVTSSEPVEGLGDGDTAPDWVVTGALTVELRAERSGNGGGRTYTISVTSTDDSGNSSSKTVTVVVPHDKGQ